MSRLLVAGIGNDMRGDDAAGLLAVRALRGLGIHDVDMIEGPADTITLAAAIADHQEVIVIDAFAAEPAGDVVIMDERSIGVRSRVTGHGLSVRDAIDMAHLLGRDPDVHVVGIAGSSFALGAAPSREVERAASQVARWIKEEFACA
jgi:hydrogenase maturation protease